jgi:hypothetical protein
VKDDAGNVCALNVTVLDGGAFGDTAHAAIYFTLKRYAAMKKQGGSPPPPVPREE